MAVVEQEAEKSAYIRVREVKQRLRTSLFRCVRLIARIARTLSLEPLACWGRSRRAVSSPSRSLELSSSSSLKSFASARRLELRLLVVMMLVRL